jgi:CBS domain-containing protein
MGPSLHAAADPARLTARELMGEPGGAVHVGASVGEVINRFLSGPSRHLAVLDEAGRCVGVLGPRHLAQAHRFDPCRDLDTPVEALGYAPWISLRPEDDLRRCAQLLVTHDLDAVPVLDPDRRVLGLVTAHAVARAAVGLAAARTTVRLGEV